jgi:hypothetical protein
MKLGLLCGVGIPILVFALSADGGPPEPGRKFSLELEAGPVWQSRNDVQIPNTAEGTRFSIADLGGTGPYAAARLYVTWRIGERHGLRLLLAPLLIKESGILDSPVKFAGETFDAGSAVDAEYKFNSWRLTYRYRFHRSARWIWWVGFTAKIRDAKIEVTQGSKSSEKTDIGFVPLLHLAGAWSVAERWWISLDLDALAGGPGRAVDAAARLGYDLGGNWGLWGGYRTVEGGADVEEVYNFAWLHYAVIAACYSF